MLDTPGDRLCILGPSDSSKSTLAVAIGATRGLPPVHLDRLHHLPHSDWRPRPEAEFAALHDAAILHDCWVIEGNYTRLLPQRLARATGVILLDVPTATILWRYIRRSLFEPARAGALEGGRDSAKWAMIRHIAITTRANRHRYRAMFDTIALRKLWLGDTAALAEFYRLEGLRR